MSEPEHHGIVLLFDDETKKRAISLSRGYRPRACDPEFALERHGRLPHLSLFHLELDQTGIRSVRDLLPLVSGILKGKPLEGSFGSIRTFDGQWCWWLPSVTPELVAVHEQSVKFCEPCRAGALRSHPVSMTETQSRLWRKYGCWWVLEAWQPHLTLQVLRPEPAESVRDEVCHPWRATSLALCRIGKFGSVQEIVHQIAI